MSYANVNTPKSSGTIISISGTTTTISETPSSDWVGRLIAITESSSAAFMQWREIVSVSSTNKTVTVLHEWDKTPILGYVEVEPNANDSYSISWTIDELVSTYSDGFSKNLDDVYTMEFALFTGGAFLFAKNILLNFRTSRVSVYKGSGIIFGNYMYKQGQDAVSTNGCLLRDLTGISPSSVRGINRGEEAQSGLYLGLFSEMGYTASYPDISKGTNSGVLELWGCRWEFKKSSSEIFFYPLTGTNESRIRLIDTALIGNINFRFDGTKSALVNVVQFDRGTSNGINPVDNIPRVELSSSRSNSMLYFWFKKSIPDLTRILGVDGTSDHLLYFDLNDSTGDKQINIGIAQTDLLKFSKIMTANASSSLHDLNLGNTIFLNFLNIDGSKNTEEYKTRIFDKNSLLVNTQKVSSGGDFTETFLKTYTIEGIHKSKALNDFIEKKPYRVIVCFFLKKFIILNLTMEKQENIFNFVFEDTDLTEKNLSVINGYTEIETNQKLYDYAKKHLYDNFSNETQTFCFFNGDTLDLRSHDLEIDSLATNVFALSNNKITIKATNFSGNLKTTGTVTLQNGSKTLGAVEDSTGKTSVFTLKNLQSSSVYVTDSNKVKSSFHSNQTGDLVLSVKGKTNTHTIIISRVGYEQFSIPFQTDGKISSLDVVYKKLLDADGTDMFKNSTTSNITFSYNSTTKKLNGALIGDVSATLFFDMLQKFLITENGCVWISEHDLPASFRYDFKSNGFFLILPRNLTISGAGNKIDSFIKTKEGNFDQTTSGGVIYNSMSLSSASGGNVDLTVLDSKFQAIQDKTDKIDSIKTNTDKLNFVGDDVKATLDSEEVDIGSVKGTPVTSINDFKASSVNLSNLDLKFKEIKDETDKIQFVKEQLGLTSESLLTKDHKRIENITITQTHSNDGTYTIGAGSIDANNKLTFDSTNNTIKLNFPLTQTTHYDKIVFEDFQLTDGEMDDFELEVELTHGTSDKRTVLLHKYASRTLLATDDPLKDFVISVEPYKLFAQSDQFTKLDLTLRCGANRSANLKLSSVSHYEMAYHEKTESRPIKSNIVQVAGVTVDSIDKFKADDSKFSAIKGETDKISSIKSETDKITFIKTKTDALNFVGDDVKATLDSEEVDIGSVKGTPVTSINDFKASSVNLSTLDSKFQAIQDETDKIDSLKEQLRFSTEFLGTDDHTQTKTFAITSANNGTEFRFSSTSGAGTIDSDDKLSFDSTNQIIQLNISLSNAPAHDKIIFKDFQLTDGSVNDLRIEVIMTHSKDGRDRTERVAQLLYASGTLLSTKNTLKDFVLVVEPYQIFGTRENFSQLQLNLTCTANASAKLKLGTVSYYQADTIRFQAIQDEVDKINAVKMKIDKIDSIKEQLALNSEFLITKEHKQIKSFAIKNENQNSDFILSQGTILRDKLIFDNNKINLKFSLEDKSHYNKIIFKEFELTDGDMDNFELEITMIHNTLFEKTVKKFNYGSKKLLSTENPLKDFVLAVEPYKLFGVSDGFSNLELKFRCSSNSSAQLKLSSVSYYEANNFKIDNIHDTVTSIKDHTTLIQSIKFKTDFIKFDANDRVEISVKTDEANTRLKMLTSQVGLSSELLITDNHKLLKTFPITSANKDKIFVLDSGYINSSDELSFSGNQTISLRFPLEIQTHYDKIIFKDFQLTGGTLNDFTIDIFVTHKTGGKKQFERQKYGSGTIIDHQKPLHGFVLAIEPYKIFQKTHHFTELQLDLICTSNISARIKLNSISYYEIAEHEKTKMRPTTSNVVQVAGHSVTSIDDFKSSAAELAHIDSKFQAIQDETDKIASIKTETNKISSVKKQTEKILSIKAQTDTLSFIKEKTDQMIFDNTSDLKVTLDGEKIILSEEYDELLDDIESKTKLALDHARASDIQTQKS